MFNVWDCVALAIICITIDSVITTFCKSPNNER